MSQGTPRKFSEKIAIMQRKQNEDEDAFAKVMQDVRSITSTTDGTQMPPGPGQQLVPGQWNRPGGSLPNVHQMVQEQPMQWGGYWVDRNEAPRGRSPGSSAHFHPYKPSRSQERVPPLHYHMPYQQAPQHLQPPDNWNSFYRARSDPAIHSHSNPHAVHMQMPPAYPGPQQEMMMNHSMGGQMMMNHANGPMSMPMQQNMNSGQMVQGQPHPHPMHNMQQQHPGMHHPMQMHQMQPGTSMQQPVSQQSHQQQMGSPMQGMSPVSSPTHTMSQNVPIQSPQGQQGMAGSPVGSSMHGSPMPGLGSGPVSPIDEHNRLMELSPPGMMIDSGEMSQVGSLPNMTSLPRQGQQPPQCYHPPVSQRHSAGCVRLAPQLTPESHSAPTSPQQSMEQQMATGWPPQRHFSFSNSPDVIDIPNIVLTGADGGAGELDCFQDLHLDHADMQMLRSNGAPEPCCETQLLN